MLRLKRRFRGLWRKPDFLRLWGSLTVTSFGAQITNLALPLTAALLLRASPLQMGVLIALEAFPFALFSLFAGVLVDRTRKLPLIMVSNVTRGSILLLVPAAAWFDFLSMPILYLVGFVCGIANVVGGAAYQVLLAQMAGRRRLVEANSKVALGENSANLVGPGLAGGLIQLVTAPFAIVLDAATFVVSILMLRNIRTHDAAPASRGVDAATVWHEIGEGLKLVRQNAILWSLAWTVALWQLLHHMQMAVIILYATRELELSAGEVGLVFVFGGVGCLLAAAFAERISARFGVGPVIVHGLVLTAVGWQMFGLIAPGMTGAVFALGFAFLLFDFGATLFGINYMALRQAITPGRLLGRMTATMRFLTVSVAPLGSLLGGALGEWLGLRATLLAVGALGLLLAGAVSGMSPLKRHRRMPAPAAD